MGGVVVNSNANADRMVVGKIQIGERDIGDLHAIDKGAVRADAPVLQLPVLRALQLPLVGRIDPALVAEIAG